MNPYVKYITESNKSKIIIALGQNWHGVYVMGDLQWQGYLENIDKFIKALENSGFLQKDSVEFKKADPKWLFDMTEFPNKLEDIKWESSTQDYRKSRIVKQKRDSRKSIRLGKDQKYRNKVKYSER